MEGTAAPERDPTAVTPTATGTPRRDEHGADENEVQPSVEPAYSAVRALIGSAVVTVGVLAAAVGLLILLAQEATTNGTEAALSLVFVAAAVVLIIVVCTLSIVFRRLQVYDRDEAMGLPRGSVRAVIALLLILLFFIAAIFLFNSTRDAPQPNSANRILNGISAEQLASIPATQIRSSRPIRLNGTTAYNVVLAPPSMNTNTSDDIAKQLVTTVGTLVTAVAAFYFGANSVSTAHKEAPAVLASVSGGSQGQPGSPAAAATQSQAFPSKKKQRRPWTLRRRKGPKEPSPGTPPK